MSHVVISLPKRLVSLVKVREREGEGRVGVPFARLHIEDAGLEAIEAFVLHAVAFVFGVLNSRICVVVGTHGVEGRDVSEGLDVGVGLIL